MFLRSMTRAPMVTCKTASRPAVKLQSLLSFFISSVAFLFHLNVPVVSSTSSTHGISFVSACNLESISRLNSSQALRVANRHSGDCLAVNSSLTLSTTGLVMTLSCRASMVFCDGQPHRTSSSMELNTPSRSLMVNSS